MENELSTGKTMTVKEVADALCVSPDTIKNCIRRIMPDKMQERVTTFLNEVEVANISKKLKNNTQVINQLSGEAGSSVKNSTTELEVIGNAMKAMSDLQKLYNQKEEEYKSIIAQKDNKLTEQQPKVEFFDAVADSMDAVDMATVSKVLDCGMGRNQIFEILRTKGVLQPNNVPYQKFVDAGMFRVVEQKYGTATGRYI